MRIKDSLEENASTFKAELNRIQQMLEVLHSKTPYLLLIDEMLRGTNSKDKLKGSLAITKKILNAENYAVIATHDLALTDIQKLAPEKVSNYFFDIDYVEGELQFDYKIKSGICKNFNASYLLEKIGVS
jgi:DNA mismatch repair ATPase MutS